MPAITAPEINNLASTAREEIKETIMISPICLIWRSSNDRKMEMMEMRANDRKIFK